MILLRTNFVIIESERKIPFNPTNFFLKILIEIIIFQIDGKDIL